MNLSEAAPEPAPDMTPSGDRPYPELPRDLGHPPAVDVLHVRGYLEVWADKFAAVGLPTVHMPRDVPLEPEEAVQEWHAGAQQRVAQWAAEARRGLQAMRSQVELRRSHMEHLAQAADAEAKAAEKELEQHTGAIAGSQPGRQHERARPDERRWGVYAPIVLVLPEYFVIAPAIGTTQNLGGGDLMLTVVALSLTQILLAEVTGARARHWVESTASRWVRRVQGVTLGICAALLGVSQLGIALARWGAGEGGLVDLLLTVGTQFGVIVLSVAVGWFHADPPEVASRRALAAEVERLRTRRDAALARHAGARRELETLDGLVAGWPAWVGKHQAVVRAIYDHELLTFRAHLRVGLERRGLDEPAYVLTETVRPVLQIPPYPAP
jgi:hypothetical protein